MSEEELTHLGQEVPCVQLPFGPKLQRLPTVEYQHGEQTENRNQSEF